MGFSRQEYWSRNCSLLQGIFPTQRLNLGLRHCQQILYCLNHQGSLLVQLRWILWRRQWQPTLVLLPGKSHGWRSLVGCSPWGRIESDTTEWLHFHFSLSCIGEGHGNPLQCSCLENPREGGAWWAAIYGVAQSRTGLKCLSSSSSRPYYKVHANLKYSNWITSLWDVSLHF